MDCNKALSGTPEDPVAITMLNRALARTLDAVVLVDSEGHVRYWNDAATRTFGFTSLEALGCPIQDLIVPAAHRLRHTVGFGEAAQTGDSAVLDHPIETEALHKEGHEFPIELTITALSHPSGFWFSCLMRDLSTRRATEEALRRSEARFHHLVETVPGMVYEFAMYADGSMAFEHVSAGCEAIYGYEASRFLNNHQLFDSLIVEEDRPSLVDSILVSARDLSPWEWEGRIHAADGTMRWIHGQSRPVRRADGATVWYGLVSDATEQRGTQTALETVNAQLEERVHCRTRELQATQREILDRLGRAAGYRDDDTGQHIERMSRTCALIAAELGLSEDECDVILKAAPMHDIGKIAIPDSILHKPGRLDAEELLTMKTHAEIGAQMLAGADSELVRVAEIIARTHHERWDGTGYPLGLAREEIPLIGRIAAVADVFDALTSERPYKRAWSVAAAVAEIEAGAGTHFDPAVVGAFRRALAGITTTATGTPLRRAA